MSTDFIINAPVALLPVLVFLVLLDRFDDHNLIRYYHIVPTVLLGCVLASVAYAINTRALFDLGIDFRAYTRFGAPLVEESLKGAAIYYFFRTARIGYSTDAAIRGFAIGAGFAVVENLVYLAQTPNLHLAVWIIRGFGTAIMHGGTTAIFAVMAAQLTEENHKYNPVLFLPGGIVATTAHSIFNHFPGNPVLSSFGSTIFITATLVWLFRGDKSNIGQDLRSDLDEHRILHERLTRDLHLGGEAGSLSADLHTEFEAWMIDDIVQYMHLHTELVITAEERIIAWKEGDTTAIGTDIRNQFNILRDMEVTLGRDVVEKLINKMGMSRQELWKLYMLESRANQETLPSDTTGKWGDQGGTKA